MTRESREGCVTVRRRQGWKMGASGHPATLPLTTLRKQDALLHNLSHAQNTLVLQHPPQRGPNPLGPVRELLAALASETEIKIQIK